MQRLPCLGAEKIDVEPTRGLNAATGKERIGKDVQRELTREGIANAIRPIAGLDAKQFEVSGRRMQLTADAQRECRNLDQALPGAEQNEAGRRRRSSFSSPTPVSAFFYDACTAADQQGISFTPAHPGPQDSKHSRGVEGD